ncbi:helix-turn-helix domain-containing protein [Streptomyces sp. BH106]|uniref:helix-turn-helix domain-containing protein n=1 Tax=Streptomyces sp. BH106 TaxID=3410409 RepID=UPI003CF718FE
MQASATPTRWITASELAALAGLHHQTVTKWAREGRIPGHHVGRRWRFEHPDVLLFLSDEVPTSAASGGGR